MSKRTRILAILFVFVLALAFTGCGFVPSSGSESSPHTLSDAKSKGNAHCYYASGDTIKNMDHKSGLLEFDTLFWEAGGSRPANYVAQCNGDHGNYTDHGMYFDTKNTGIKFLRNIAVFMHNSTFGGSELDWDASQDPFMDDAWEEFDLSPITLIQKVNRITMGAISLTGDLSTPVGSEVEGLPEIITAIKGLSIAVLITVWSMGFISQVVNEKFTMETLLKTLMQLLCGIMITLNAELIVTLFAEAGNTIINSYSNDTNPNNAFAGFAASVHYILSHGVVGVSIAINFIVAVGVGTIWIDYGCILAILYLIFPLIAVIICAYKILSQMIMRMLELLLRIIFAPIPLAFSAQQGFSHEAIRYFRGIMACALQPVMMIVGCLMIPTIAGVVALVFSSSASAAADVDASTAIEAASKLTGFLGTFGMTLAYLILSSFLGQVKQLSQDIIAR